MPSVTPVVIDWVLTSPRKQYHKAKAPFPPYGLGLLKAQTPPRLLGHPVIARVHDEQIHGSYDPSVDPPDILGLSTLTPGAPQAYMIGDQAMQLTSYAGRPITVMIGGIHATCLPLEAMMHSHMVVRGEVTPEFQRFLLERALLWDHSKRDVFRLGSISDTVIRPPVDWSWVDRNDYWIHYPILLSFGCPFGCSYCSVTRIFGAKTRYVDEQCTRTELDAIPVGSSVLVVDDNIMPGCNARLIERLIKVADLLHERKFKWAAEVTLVTLKRAHDRHLEEKGFNLLQYLADHGCHGLFFGIETIDEDSTLKKAEDLSNQEIIDFVHECQSHGIAILGAFVVGLGPDETLDYAKQVAEFAIEKAKFDVLQCSINTPLPGSDDFITAIRDGTLLHRGWAFYDCGHAVIKHPRMSIEQLEDSLRLIYHEFYSLKSFRTRELRPLVDALIAGSWVDPPRAVWRRFKYIAAANLGLRVSTERYERQKPVLDSINVGFFPYEETVMDQVRNALNENPDKPGNLFNIINPDDGISTLFTSEPQGP